MELLVVRYHKKQTYTIGKLYINGTYFCDTLEDTDIGLHSTMTLAEVVVKKQSGHTAIPTGRYLVELTLSPRFGRTLPVLIGVKGFDGIRIHRGNTDEDTVGCILVGENKAVGKVLNSANTEQRLMDALRQTQHGEKIYCTVV